MTVCYWKWPLILDFPKKTCWFSTAMFTYQRLTALAMARWLQKPRRRFLGLALGTWGFNKGTCRLIIRQGGFNIDMLGKSQFSVGKSIISIAIFHSSVCLPEGSWGIPNGGDIWKLGFIYSSGYLILDTFGIPLSQERDIPMNQPVYRNLGWLRDH